jgi:hypothetical protein
MQNTPGQAYHKEPGNLGPFFPRTQTYIRLSSRPASHLVFVVGRFGNGELVRVPYI